MSGAVEAGGAKRLVAITPNDDTTVNFDALYIGTGGNVAILAFGDSAAVTLADVPNGILPIKGRKVMATNTTASGIVGLIY